MRPWEKIRHKTPAIGRSPVLEIISGSGKAVLARAH
jgi:hypothetical protein